MVTGPEVEKPGLRTGAQAPPPVDPGNEFISVAPSNLTCSVQQTPAGQFLFATVRTINATLTATLQPDEVDVWIEVLQRERAKMTGLILPG